MTEDKSDENNPLVTKYDRIFRLLCEVVNESPSIKDVSEYPQSPAYFYRYWTLDEKDWKKSLEYRKKKRRGYFIDVFKHQLSHDIILLIPCTQSTFTAWFEIALFDIAHLLFTAAERELSSPDVERIFEIDTTQKREETIDYAVKAILRRFFWALPNLVSPVTNRALHDSILSYIKTDVERMNKLRWKKLELKKDFEYLPHEILELLDQSIKPVEDWRQRFIGNIREIPEPELSKLPERYKELCAAYKDAKKEHGKKKTKFLAAENRRSIEDWREQWKKEFDYYPDLYEDCLMLICEDETLMPRQLAYQHLSFDWGYSPDHIRRIINQQKALKREGDKKVAHPDEK